MWPTLTQLPFSPVPSTVIAIQATMSSSSRFSYQRLRKLPAASIIEEDEEQAKALESRAGGGGGGRRPTSSWLRLRLRRRRRWRRPRVRIGSLIKRKAVVVRSALGEVVKRLKEGRPYIGDLFAGNYMFMQVAPPSPAWPTPLIKSFLPAAGPHFYGAAAAAAAAAAMVPPVGSPSSSSSSSSSTSRFNLSGVVS